MESLEPWPVDEIKVAGFIHYACLSISTSSINVYLAGVRYGHENTVLEPWPLEDNELIRRTKRFVKRRFPSKRALTKLLISLRVIRVILPLLPKWPRFDLMKIDDLLFAASSTIATRAFMRGGEAFVNNKKNRTMLTRGMLVLSMARMEEKKVESLVINIPQAKMTPHFISDPVTIFRTPEAGPFDAVVLWKAYLARCPTRTADQPAFQRENGQAMDQLEMINRTNMLIRQAGIPLVDSTGKPAKICAASWRAGGVRSAMDAQVNEYTIMAYGRWTSRAWKSYMEMVPLDLWHASQMMVRCSVAAPKELLVGDAVAAELGLKLDEEMVTRANSALRKRSTGKSFGFNMRPRTYSRP
jgi:hypothetical protein